MRLRTRKYFALIVTFVFIISSMLVTNPFEGLADGNTIYIDPSFVSEEARDGSIENPFASWVNVVFQEGYTYLQKRGTICEISDAIRTLSNVTLGAYGDGERPIIKLIGTGANRHAILSSNRNNIIIENLEIYAPEASTCIYLSGADNKDNEVVNCVLHGADTGVSITGTAAGNAAGIKVLNTEIYNVGGNGVFIQNVLDVEVAYSNIHHIRQRLGSGRGIFIESGKCDGFNIHHNILDLSDVTNVSVIELKGDLVKFDSGRIEYNHIVGQGYGGWTAVNLASTIDKVSLNNNIIENADYGVAGECPEVEATGNILNYLTRGFHYRATNVRGITQNNTFYDVKWPYRHMKIAADLEAPIEFKNNLAMLTENNEWCIMISEIADYANFQSDNNLVYPEKNAFIRMPNKSYNTFSEWNTATGNDANSLAVDPKLVKPRSGNFRLSADSPAIGKGIGANVEELMNTGIGVNGAVKMAVKFVVDPEEPEIPEEPGEPYTIYIDPSSEVEGTRDGSIGKPFASWLDVNFQESYTYLQKRGTKDTVNVEIFPISNMTMGAYGEGDRPAIYSMMSHGDVAGGQTYIINARNVKNLTIRDLEIYSYVNLEEHILGSTSCILVEASTEGISENVLIENCILHDAEWGIRIFRTLNAKILNNEIYNTGDDGIFAGYVSSNMEIGYNYIHDVNQRFHINTDDKYSSGDCIQLNNGCDGFWIHHNILDHSSTGNKFALIIHGQKDIGNTDTGIVEHNTMISGPMATIYLHSTVSNVIIRYNILEDSPYGVFNDQSQGLVFHDNILNRHTVGVHQKADLSAKIYNNTFYNTRTAFSHTAIPKTEESLVLFKNNIVMLMKLTDKLYNFVAVPDYSKLQADYNLIYPRNNGFINSRGLAYNNLKDWTSVSNSDKNSMIGDPGFANMAQGNFRLTEYSPAIGGGIVVDAATQTAPVNIGADIEKIFNTNIGVDASVKMSVKYIDDEVPETPVGVNPEDVLQSKLEYKAGTYYLGAGIKGIYEVEYDVTPEKNNINGVMAFADDASSIMGLMHTPIYIVMNKDGIFHARNGNVNSKDAIVEYEVGSTYHVKILANLKLKTYDVFITSPGGSPIQIASNYAFRPDAGGMVNIGQISLKSGANDQFSVSNLTRNFAGEGPTEVPDPLPPEEPEGPELGTDFIISKKAWVEATHVLKDAEGEDIYKNGIGIYTIEYDVRPLLDNIDCVMAFVDNATTITGWGNINVAARMNSAGMFDAKNNGNYDRDDDLRCFAGKSYHVRVILNLFEQKYDVYATPYGGSELRIAQDFIPPINPSTNERMYFGDISKVCFRSGADDQFEVRNLTATFTDQEEPEIPEEPVEYEIETTLNMETLQAGKLLEMKVNFTSKLDVDKAVLAIVGLYDKNNSLVNFSYVSKNVIGGATEGMAAGFNLPTVLDGHFVKVFVWEGNDITTSSMVPLSKVIELR